MRFLPRFRTALTLGWPLTSHRCDPKTQTSQILTWSGLDHTPLHLILLLSSPCPVVIPHSVSSRTHHRKNSDTFILLLQPARPPSITIWTSCSVMPVILSITPPPCTMGPRLVRSRSLSLPSPLQAPTLAVPNSSPYWILQLALVPMAPRSRLV